MTGGMISSMGEMEPKGRITLATVAAVAAWVDSLDLDAKEHACDELADTQPVALGFVVHLSHLGVSIPDMNHILNVLLVVAECFRRTAAKPLPQITKEMLEAAAKKTNAMSRLLEGESTEAERVGLMMVDEYPEQSLFAYVMGYMDEKGLTRPSPEDVHAVFAVVVFMEAFRQAASLAQGLAE